MNFVAVARAIDELASLLTGESLDPPDDSGAASTPLPADQGKLMGQMVESINKIIKNTQPDLLPLDLTNDVLEDLEALDDLLEHAFHARNIERIKLLKTMAEIIHEIEAALLAVNDEEEGG